MKHGHGVREDRDAVSVDTNSPSRRSVECMSHVCFLKKASCHRSVTGRFPKMSITSGAIAWEALEEIRRDIDDFLKESATAASSDSKRKGERLDHHSLDRCFKCPEQILTYRLYFHRKGASGFRGQ